MNEKPPTPNEPQSTLASGSEDDKECRYKLMSPSGEDGGEIEDLLKKKKPGEGKTRIQALLADWLRMENIVVLTGAGCSKAAGGLLMSASPQKNGESLEERVLGAVKECNITDEAKAIIDWRLSNSKEGSFEEWLSYIFNAPNLATENSPIASLSWKTKEQAPLTLPLDASKQLRGYLEKAIFAECALQLPPLTPDSSTKNEDSAHIPFLAKLISRDAKLGRTHLFTLNYDTLFEQAMEELSIQYFDGFSGKTSGRFEPAIYGLDMYYPGDVSEGRIRRFDKFLHFYKLHGSIHWYLEEGDMTHRARHQDLSIFKKYRDPNLKPEEKAGKLQSDYFKPLKPIGILPTQQKYTQMLDMPYAHLFRLFHARLHQPQTFLLILGYGFGDEHVNKIIETALTNPSLIMLVVEPNPESVLLKEKFQTYSAIKQRIFVLTSNCQKPPASTDEQGATDEPAATFSDFARNIMPDVQWLEDFTRLRKYEYEIRKTKNKTPHTRDEEG